jgi:hypothetical protein
MTVTSSCMNMSMKRSLYFRFFLSSGLQLRLSCSVRASDCCVQDLNFPTSFSLACLREACSVSCIEATV